MKNQLELLNNLTAPQKKEFEKDLKEVYTICSTNPGFPMASRNEATVNMNLLNEVYLQVTFDFEEVQIEKVKGRIFKVYQYENKKEYEEAVAKEKSLLN